MKILIIGGSAIVGSKMYECLIKNNNSVEFTYNTNNVSLAKGYRLDITKKINTIKIIEKINPDVVIHTAALTNLDLCEKNHSLADSVNVLGTENIIQGCKTIGSKIVYISTSFVFDGRKQEYFEDDPTSPATYYGFTKWKGEELVKNSDLSYLILRTDALYGWIERWQRDNSVTRALKTLLAGNLLREVTDWYNTPTYVQDFTSAAGTLIEDDMTGIYHLSGSDFVSRYQWSVQVADVFGLDKNMIVPINSRELNLSAKRVNINLKNQKLFDKMGIQMKGVREGLVDMLSNN